MEKLSLRFNSDDDLLDYENDTIIQQYAEMSDAVIIAWGCVGNQSQRVRDRQAEVLELLKNCKNKLYKIGEKGCHPLTPAVRNSWDLEPYEMEKIQMIKLTNLGEIKAISEPEIRNYIYKKATELMAEYSVDTLDDIGCFVVLDKEEIQLFEVSEMEFVEVITLEKTSYSQLTLKHSVKASSKEENL